MTGCSVCNGPAIATHNCVRHACVQMGSHPLRRRKPTIRWTLVQGALPSATPSIALAHQAVCGLTAVYLARNQAKAY